MIPITIPMPPPLQILMRMKERGAAANYAAAGIEDAVTVRHARNRKPVRGEVPAVSLILVSDEAHPVDVQHNEWEIIREMVVDVQVDLGLPPEDGGSDDTGLMYLMLVTSVFISALRDPEQASWLGGLCDWVSVGALEPNDRSTPDEGRMTRVVHVLYRTRSDDENVLLAAGVNG